MSSANISSAAFFQIQGIFPIMSILLILAVLAIIIGSVSGMLDETSSRLSFWERIKKNFNRMSFSQIVGFIMGPVVVIMVGVMILSQVQDALQGQVYQEPQQINYIPIPDPHPLSTHIYNQNNVQQNIPSYINTTTYDTEKKKINSTITDVDLDMDLDI